MPKRRPKKPISLDNILAELSGEEKPTRRPVKCAVCKKQMYYAGDPKYEPEVQLAITATNDYMFEHPILEVQYMHRRCAEPIIALIKKLKSRR